MIYNYCNNHVVSFLVFAKYIKEAQLLKLLIFPMLICPSWYGR